MPDRAYQEGDRVIATLSYGEVGGSYLYPSAPGYHFVKVYVLNGAAVVVPDDRLRPAKEEPTDA